MNLKLFAAYALWTMALVAMSYVNASELGRTTGTSSYAVLSTIVLNALAFAYTLRKINEKF